jgi:hypothetical protein
MTGRIYRHISHAQPLDFSSFHDILRVPQHRDPCSSLLFFFISFNILKTSERERGRTLHSWWREWYSATNLIFLCIPRSFYLSFTSYFKIDWIWCLCKVWKIIVCVVLRHLSYFVSIWGWDERERETYSCENPLPSVPASLSPSNYRECTTQ